METSKLRSVACWRATRIESPITRGTFVVAITGSGAIVGSGVLDAEVSAAVSVTGGLPPSPRVLITAATSKTAITIENTLCPSAHWAAVWAMLVERLAGGGGSCIMRAYLSNCDSR
jgi:hypothetical protein